MIVYLYPRAAAAVAEGRCSTFDLVGPIPHWADESDPRDAVSQIDSNYAHGGGWRDASPLLRLREADSEWARLVYPGDPPFPAVARWQLRDETIILFALSYVAVIQPDGSYRVARID